MSNPTLSRALRPSRALALCALLTASAPAAWAIPVTFDVAPDPGEDASHGLGVSLETALASGLEFVSAASGPFSVVDEDPDGNVLPSSPLQIDASLTDFHVTSRSEPATAVEHWEVANNTGFAQPDTLVLAFRRPLENWVDVDGTLEGFEYALGEVSLDFGLAGDWMILQVPDATTGETWYFPAVRLGPLDLAGSTALDLDLTLLNPRIFPEMASLSDDEFELGLPRWEVRAYYVVPEPSTALLLGLGCTALALRPPRRS